MRPESAITRVPPGDPGSGAFAHAAPGIGYLESSLHYEAVARRALAEMRGACGSITLLIGDPPADGHALTVALGKIVGTAWGATTISCGPEFKLEELDRAFSLAASSVISRLAGDPEPAAFPSPLFVFDKFDRLSDRQIEEICQIGLGQDRLLSAAILLTRPDFVIRFQRPALRLLKERMTAELRFQEVSDDETVAFLHDQLLTDRNRKAQARGFRRGIKIGLGAAGVAIAANLAVFLLHPADRQVGDMPASSAEKNSEDGPSLLRPKWSAEVIGAAEPAALNAEITAAIATAPVLSGQSPIKVQNPTRPAATSAVQPPSGLRLDVAEIDALLARGDSFFIAGDITSARPFYARAAEAGSSRAAMQLGATFDPAFRSARGLSGATTEQAQALFWYQRASKLGAPEAEQRIKDLTARPREPTE